MNGTQAIPACSVDGCSKPHKARGWCKFHYECWRRHGDPLAGRPRFASDEERFWSKVLCTDQCWTWTGSRSGPGYGQFSLHESGKRWNVQAHRMAWELLRGPIPSDLQLDHLCCNKLCVNPDHLEPVTGRENLLRGNGQSAINARKEHCHRGHPLGGKNLHIRLDGSRHCRACDRLRQRQYRARKRDGEVAA